LNDDEIVSTVLVDGDEVLFDLESFDLWLKIAFNLMHKEELWIHGMTEVRMEKSENVRSLKKKLQKVAYDMWSKALDSHD
jgi:hypothetical protein